MARTEVQLVEMIAAETNYRPQIIRTVLDSFFKHLLWSLVDDEENKVLIRNFATFEMKRGCYNAGEIKAGINKPVSPNYCKLKGKFTSGFSRSINAEGIENAILQHWGERLESLQKEA